VQDFLEHKFAAQSEGAKVRLGELAQDAGCIGLPHAMYSVLFGAQVLSCAN
jgi:hypothetical protein